MLTAPVSSSQTVLMKLQLTFAFLKNTMRAIYSPSDLLKVARPPWFESGRQQDCSEFLRYLLDTLHEQGKRPEPKATGKKTSSLPPEADADELAAGRVKPSYSTTALDAIAEDPENPAEPSDQVNDPFLRIAWLRSLTLPIVPDHLIGSLENISADVGLIKKQRTLY